MERHLWPSLARFRAGADTDRRASFGVIVLLVVVVAASASAEPSEQADLPPLGPGEVAGTGQVVVVGGNLVSARRRALDLARRDAVAAAVASMLPPAQLGEHLATLRGGIYRRHSYYIQRYRVLRETREGKTFKVLVAAVVNSKRLRSDLVRLTGVKPMQPAEGGPRVGVTVQVGASAGQGRLPSAIAREVSSRVSAGGYRVTGLSGQSDPGRSTCQALLSIRVDVHGAEGVRGLGLAGARAVASARLSIRNSGTVVAQSRVERWGVGQSPALAGARAARRAVERLAADVLEGLRRQWPRGAARRGYVVRLSRVSSLQQLLAVERHLRRGVSGVRHVAAWRFAAGEAWLMVRGEVRLPDLSRLLASREFQTSCPAAADPGEDAPRRCGPFRLRLKSADGGAAWFTVQ